MSFPVGIGIVTYNRRAILSDTIDQVRAFTRQPNAALVVADDGSSDGTLGMLRDNKVPVITGTLSSRSIPKVPSLDPSSATTSAAFG